MSTSWSGNGAGDLARPGPGSPTSLAEEFPRLLLDRRYAAGSVADLESARASARAYASHHVRPRALEIDARVGADHDYFDWDVVRAALPYRLLSLVIPSHAGGAFRGGTASVAVVMEELCAACPGVANIFGAHALGVSPLLVAGVAQWDGCLAEIVRAERDGEPVLMACAVTEPSAGTDVEDPQLLRRAAINTHARQVSGGYRLAGTKCFISNGNVARWITVLMPVDPQRPAETWSCFLVDARSDGFSVGRVERKLGQRACPAAEIVFDDVFVPDERLIGRVGDGLPVTMMILATSRPIVGAIATGIARGAYERLREWVAGKGAAVAERQYLHLALAEIETEIHLARQAYMDAATELEQSVVGPLMRHPLVRGAAVLPRRLRRSGTWQRWMNSPAGRDRAARVIRAGTTDRAVTRTLGLSSLAKVVGADVAVSVTNRALEVVGLDAGPVRAELEKLWRDAKLTQIYEGTNQLNRLEVYRALCARETIESLPSVAVGGAR